MSVGMSSNTPKSGGLDVFQAFISAGSSGNPLAAVGGQILASMFAPDSDQSAAGGTTLSGQGAFAGENDIKKKAPLLDFANPIKLGLMCAAVFGGMMLIKKIRG